MAKVNRSKRSKPKTVKVEISASQKVHYKQIREMSVEDWNKLQAAIESDDWREINRVHKDLVETYINTHDVFDADDIEGDDVEITGV